MVSCSYEAITNLILPWVDLKLFGQSNNVPLKTYLALGDSYTIGESVTEALRWPNQLIEELNEKVVFDPATIVAKTGWTTDELMEELTLQH